MEAIKALIEELNKIQKGEFNNELLTKAKRPDGRTVGSLRL